LVDNANSWQLGSNGKYKRRGVESGAEPFSAHGYFMQNPSLSGRGQALSTDAPLPLEIVFAESLRKKQEE